MKMMWVCIACFMLSFMSEKRIKIGNKIGKKNDRKGSVSALSDMTTLLVKMRPNREQF